MLRVALISALLITGLSGGDVPTAVTTANPTTAQTATGTPTTSTKVTTDTTTGKPTTVTTTGKPTTVTTTGKPTTVTTTGKPTSGDSSSTAKPTSATSKDTTATPTIATTTAKPTSGDSSSTANPTTKDSSSTAKPTTKDSSSTAKPTTANPTTANPTTKDSSSTAKPTTRDSSSTAKPTTKDSSSTAKPTTANPTTRDSSSTAKPTTKDSSSTANPTTKDSSSTAKPTSGDSSSTAKPTKDTTTTEKPSSTTQKESTTSTRSDTTSTTKGTQTTNTDDHGSYSCQDLDFDGCIKYSRCAWVISERNEGNSCDIQCGSCIDTEYYGTCNDYRKRVSSDNSDIKKVICYGDSVNSKDGTAKCYNQKCSSLEYQDCLQNVNLDGPGCVWVVSGDECIENYCGYCSYAPAPCEKYKNCLDDTEHQTTTVYYCSDSTDVVDCQSTTADPTCNYDCKSYPYSDCILDDSCAWINVEDYYGEKSNCPNGCGYCSPACQYSVNGTCEGAKLYFECQQLYQDDGKSQDTTLNPSSTSTDTSSGQKVFCEGDETPENANRCFVDDRSGDESSDCKKFGYDDCISSVATDNNGSCAWVVNDNCYSSCGYCTAVPYSCSDYKSCNDFDSRSGSSGDSSNSWHATTYYCGDKEPATKNCEKTQTACTGQGYEDCLKAGSDGHCVWYQYESIDYRCGWCGFVCDSCQNEQSRIAKSYGENEYFYGASYHALCDASDKTLIKDCKNCYGKKSRCANALCAEEVKSCNADQDCSDSAFKAMCFDYGEKDGSYFYADVVQENDVIDNTTTSVFALCMKNKCFDDNDEEIIHEFESQTTGVTCSFGYARLEVLFDVCLTTSNLAYLCRENYAQNFHNVIATDTGAAVNWDFPDSKCEVFGISGDGTKKRRLQSQTTQDPTNPWDRITKSTGTPEAVPTKLDCLQVQVIVTYPSKDSYESDLAKFDLIKSKASNLEPDGQVQVIEQSIECCVEDDVCKNYRSASVILHSAVAIVIACASLLFL